MDALIAYLESHIQREPNSGCWLWDGAPGAGGYGTARHEGRNQKAHRVSWIAHRGPIPPGLKALHHCDTPPCVNPDHLFLGTQLDNIADMVAKGRQRGVSRFGSESPVAKLDELRVCLMRNLLDIGATTQREIAPLAFGVSPMTVSRIARGLLWPHVSMTWDLEHPA